MCEIFYYDRRPILTSPKVFAPMSGSRGGLCPALVCQPRFRLGVWEQILDNIFDNISWLPLLYLKSDIGLVSRLTIVWWTTTSANKNSFFQKANVFLFKQNPFLIYFSNQNYFNSKCKPNFLSSIYI